MNEPHEAERITFHTTIHGGQQAIGSHNTQFVQHNYGPSRPDEEFREVLEEIKRRLGALPDPEPARAQVAIVEGEVARRSADSSRALQALRTLRGIATDSTALAEAVAKAVQLVARHWPLWPQ